MFQCSGLQTMSEKKEGFNNTALKLKRPLPAVGCVPGD